MAATSASLQELVDSLARKARADYYNPYTRFDWPPALPADAWWMSPEFLSVHGTSLVEDEVLLKSLARYETVNFFSLNIHGIRELIVEVALRIHTPRFAAFSDFLHHFLGEENEHMWFFAEFCNRYHGKIYPALPSFPAKASFGVNWKDVIVFGRIVIFEEIVDYYNKRIGADGRLPAVVRELHSAHHHDESRHVAFGKRFVKHLYDNAVAADDQGGARADVENYLKSYMSYSVASLYSARAYRDAGIARTTDIRRSALAHPARQQFHLATMARVNNFFVNNGIFETKWAGVDGS